MRVLSTRFRVDAALDRSSLFNMVAEALDSDINSSMDIRTMDWQAEMETSMENPARNERVSAGNYSQAFVLQHSMTTGTEETGVIYITTCVLRDKDPEPSLYVKIERETTDMNTEAPATDNMAFPAILRGIFWNEWGGSDGGLPTEDRPYLIRKADTDRIVGLLNGQGPRLLNPIVYVSVDAAGKPAIDCDSLAGDLAGQAHVLLEASPVVSAQAQAAAKKAGISLPIGGTIAVFVPGTTVKTMSAGTLDTQAFQTEVLEAVRAMLLNFSIEPIYDAARLRHEYLVDKLGGEGSELAQICEDMLHDTEASLSAMKRENAKLKQELAAARAQIGALRDGLNKSEQQEGGKFITLEISENDLYDGEVRDVILRTLSQAKDGMNSDDMLQRCRKYHVLSDVLEHNFPCGADASLIECVRSAFEDGALTRDGIGRLRAAGFVVEKTSKGGHFKLYLKSDSRYTGTFGSTVSDKGRAAKNFVSEFCNLLFGY